jgi:glycosyltransferase involved in cell wall biosynthesis
MQICYDYQVFAAQKYGGISRYFTEIASRIHHPPDANVRVIAPLYRNRYLEEKRSLIPVTGTYLSKNFARATGLCLRVDAVVSKAITASYRPDIVHETYYSPERTVKSGNKTVVTVYDTTAELFSDDRREYPIIIPARKTVFDRADHLICISNNTRADLIRLYNIDPAKVSVIHLASSIIPSKKPAVEAPEPFFLFVGGRWGYKNFDGLAKAYRDSGLYKSHKLVCFAADTFAGHELENLKKLGLPLDRFEIIDGDDDELARYYASAVALVYPSLYEGFGIPLLEAMECGCPVLCGNTSSMPEVAGDAALYFDPSDPSAIGQAMLRIANSLEERQKLVQRGKDRVRQFSWDRCAQETFALYERLLSR